MDDKRQQDEAFMRRCLELARTAAAHDEVPVGALVVLDGTIVGEGRNRCEELVTPLAHAELEALHGAFATLRQGRIPGATLYCTLEPCLMCTGAALHARVARIVYGARDPKFGACGSLYDLPRDVRLNHRCAVDEGVLAADSAALLREFFQRLRG
ncbi:MAG TPA: tRNA adenosine(34) deaminase TadA [Planctomycetota bacterium]|nr:tRNA adenosine(34) deaminase TadA [Planctomycetota bacterium]